MIDKNFFTIGQVSRIKGMTRKALRFYERIGLITPHHTDPANGYRYYSVEQFVRLDIIRAARDMEIGLKELKAVMTRKDMDELTTLLETQADKTIDRIKDLERTVRRMERVRHTIKSSREAISRRGVYRKSIAARTVVRLDFDGILDAEDAFVRYATIDRIIEENRLINAYETGIIAKPDGNGSVRPAHLFTVVEKTAGSNGSVVSTIRRGEYICVCFTESNAQDRNRMITRYLAKNRVVPRLVLQVELLNDVFSVNSNWFELQVLG